MGPKSMYIFLVSLTSPIQHQHFFLGALILRSSVSCKSSFLLRELKNMNKIKNANHVKETFSWKSIMLSNRDLAHSRDGSYAGWKKLIIQPFYMRKNPIPKIKGSLLFCLLT